MTILNLMKKTKFSKRRENTVGKGEIAHYELFLLFPWRFQDLHCKHVKASTCLGKGLVKSDMCRSNLILNSSILKSKSTDLARFSL